MSRKRTLDWDAPSSATKRPDTNDVNPWTGRKYSPQYYEILAKRKELPVWEQKEEFFSTFAKNQCMVLQGETGSGKTTQARFLLLSPFVSPFSASIDGFSVFLWKFCISVLSSSQFLVFFGQRASCP